MATSDELRLKHENELQAYAKWAKDHQDENGDWVMDGLEVGEFHTRNAAVEKAQNAVMLALELERADAVNRAAMGSQGRVIKPESKDTPKRPQDLDELELAVKGAMSPHADALKALAEGDISKGFPQIKLPVGLKTIVALTDHYAQAQRAQTTGSALYYNTVEDIFQSGQTNSNNIEYFIQTTDTDNAAFVAEVTAATDSYFTWTKYTDEVEDVQTWIPISRDLISDEGFMLSTIQGLLADRLSKIISKELMYGTGTTPHLWGATVRTGFATQAKGTDPVFDCILKAINLVAVTADATPDHIVMHPTDWQNICLTRTTDGIYLMGNPANAPANPAIWGLPVRVSSTVAAAAGTAAVGAFRTMAQVFYNGGLVVETSTEHSTYFTERKIALALRQRLGVVHYRPTAFVKITGL